MGLGAVGAAFLLRDAASLHGLHTEVPRFVGVI